MEWNSAAVCRDLHQLLPALWIRALPGQSQGFFGKARCEISNGIATDDDRLQEAPAACIALGVFKEA